MDTARKFLQMGYKIEAICKPFLWKEEWWTGSASSDSAEWVASLCGRNILPKDEDPVKGECARIFYEKYHLAISDMIYDKMKKEWQSKYG